MTPPSPSSTSAPQESDARDALRERQALAHDLRSSIRAIVIYSDLMQRELGDRDVDHRKLEHFSVAMADAAGELVSRLDEFTDSTS